MLINLLAFILFLIVWGIFLWYQIKYKNFLFITILVSFAQQYIIPQIYYFSQWTIDNRYYAVTENEYFNMICCCFIFIIGLLIGQLCIGTKLFEQCKDFFITETGFNLEQIKKVLFIISVVSIILQFKSFVVLFGANMLQNRLIANQGSGYLQFLNVTSYFIVFIGIKQYLSGKLSLKLLLLHAIPAFIIYSLKLQRGHSVYPLFMILVTYIYTHFKTYKASLIVVILAIIMLYIGNITNIIRSSIVDKNEYAEAQHKVYNTIPSSYAHTELLCAIIADNSVKDLPNTLYGAAVNWIPRAIYKNKPKTLGPVLNNHFSPDNSFYRLNGIHRSSYTTDLLIEGFYHMRYCGVLLFAIIFSIISSSVWYSITLEKNKDTFFMTFPLALYIIGYTGFFSDMGNWIGYMVIYYSVYFFIVLCARTKKAVYE